MPQINFHNIDCMEFMKDIPDKHYQLGIVDPDYGLDSKISCGGTWAAKYKKGQGNLGGIPNENYFKELFRVCENYIIWGGNYFSNLIPASRCFIVWRKIQMLGMHTMADCELALTSFDRNAKIFDTNTSRNRIHITQKPIELYRLILQNYAKPNDKIIDTHFGSGSIAIACHMEGFDLDCCEIDLEYYNAAIKRYNLVTSQLKLF